MYTSGVGHREKLEAARVRVEQEQKGLGQATAQRMQAVREASNDGVPPTRIAEWAGIARSRVYQIAAQPEEQPL